MCVSVLVMVVLLHVVVGEGVVETTGMGVLRVVSIGSDDVDSSHDGLGSHMKDDIVGTGNDDGDGSSTLVQFSASK